MKKTVFALAACIMLSSCAVFRAFDPYDHGYALGLSSYSVYTRLAAQKDVEFRKDVEDMWAKVNNIRDTRTLATDMLEVTGAIDRILGSRTLTDREREILKGLKSMVLRPVDGRLSGWAAGHDDAVRFLEGFRAGVNAMAEAR